MLTSKRCLMFINTFSSSRPWRIQFGRFHYFHPRSAAGKSDKSWAKRYTRRFVKTQKKHFCWKTELVKTIPCSNQSTSRFPSFVFHICHLPTENRLERALSFGITYLLFVEKTKKDIGLSWIPMLTKEAKECATLLVQTNFNFWKYLTRVSAASNTHVRCWYVMPSLMGSNRDWTVSNTWDSPLSYICLALHASMPSFPHHNNTIIASC